VVVCYERVRDVEASTEREKQYPMLTLKREAEASSTGRRRIQELQ
jgi:hypothetical protein